MPRRSPEYMQNQRLRFCEAAMACFSRKGVTASNLTDICDEAGLSMGALYKHFSSREDLLEAVLQLQLTRRNELLVGKSWTDLRGGIVRYRQQLEQSPFWRELEGVVDWNQRLKSVRIREGRVILEQLRWQLEAYAEAGEIAPPFDLTRTAQLVSVVFSGSLANVRASGDLAVSLDDFTAYLDLAVGYRQGSAA